MRLTRIFVLSLALFLVFPTALLPQFTGRNYGRSMVITQQGIVATSQALASQAGAQILARGASAATCSCSTGTRRVEN
jgi:gamma-glutamyltranspeptidase/glutathione hydrolase